MKYKFFQGGVTEAPVECLIEDYQNPRPGQCESEPVYPGICEEAA